jgi:hypothetical protein
MLTPEHESMTWLAWLAVAVVVTAIAAITGIQPKGARPVAHTSLMGVARFALLGILVICVYMALRGRFGG